MSSYVAQRRREIGIRMALGARAGDVLRQTIVQGGRLAVIGTIVGLALAVALSRLMESALFGVIGIEIWLFAAIAALLLAIALLASILPARQAAAVDPIAALRAE
jgi:ABC-type antimicrobial peptide transport system permease subunit